MYEELINQKFVESSLKYQMQLQNYASGGILTGNFPRSTRQGYLKYNFNFLCKQKTYS